MLLNPSLLEHLRANADGDAVAPCIPAAFELCSSMTTEKDREKRQLPVLCSEAFVSGTMNIHVFAGGMLS